MTETKNLQALADMEGKTLREVAMAAWDHGVDLLDAHGGILGEGDLMDGLVLYGGEPGDTVGDLTVESIYIYGEPEDLIDEDEGIIHPVFAPTNCNWRNHNPAWDEKQAKVYGEIDFTCPDGTEYTAYLVG